MLWNFSSLLVSKTLKLTVWSIHFWAQHNFSLLGLTSAKLYLLALAVRLFTLFHYLLDGANTCRFAENSNSFLSLKRSIWHLNWSARHYSATHHSVIKLDLIRFLVVKTGPWEEIRGINSVFRRFLLHYLRSAVNTLQSLALFALVCQIFKCFLLCKYSYWVLTSTFFWPTSLRCLSLPKKCTCDFIAARQSERFGWSVLNNTSCCLI